MFHNKSMEWYYIVLLIFAIIIFILCLPMWWQARVYINAITNLGVIAISIFGIPIICFQIELQNQTINIIRIKKEDKQVPINIIDKGAIFANYFIERTLNLMWILQFSIFFGAGITNDAFKPALLNGAFLILANTITGWLFTKRGEFPCYLGLDSDSAKDELKVSGYISLVVMPISIIISLIVALYRTKKVVKNYERILRQNQN